MGDVAYTRGLHRLGEGCSVWFEPPGSWGLSNSGVLVAGEEALVVDTQNDMPRARALADAIRLSAPSATVTTVVNTHADGDHWLGNVIFEGARIVAGEAAAAGMRSFWLDPRRLDSIGVPGTVLHDWIGWRRQAFDYRDWRPVYPTETFVGRRRITVGSVEVELIEVGPAHTAGDVVVHVPEAGVVFAGDILFHRSTPIAWSGPVTHWITALEGLLALGAGTVVPGHGPLAGPNGVCEARDYLSFVLAHGERSWRAGLSPREAYRTIDLGRFEAWPHTSRVLQTLQTVYRDLDPCFEGEDVLETILADDHGADVTLEAR
jgi:cyclase